jgi:hypothetical protein
MSFREKSAWISALSVLVCFGIYFGVAFTRRLGGMENGFLLLKCVGAFVALQIGLNLGLGIPLHLYHAAGHQLMGLAALDLVITGFVVAVAQIVMFRRGF